MSLFSETQTHYHVLRKTHGVKSKQNLGLQCHDRSNNTPTTEGSRDIRLLLRLRGSRKDEPEILGKIR
jgi:hypothetical protein